MLSSCKIPHFSYHNIEFPFHSGSPSNESLIRQNPSPVIPSIQFGGGHNQLQIQPFS